MSVKGTALAAAMIAAAAAWTLTVPNLGLTDQDIADVLTYLEDVAPPRP